MEKTVESALRIIEGTGPVGAYIAAGLVGLTLAAIVFARLGNLWDTSRSEARKTDFLDLMVTQYERLMTVEANLRAEGERIEAENDALKERLREGQAAVELMRIQFRRVIELLRAVKEGRMKPEDLPADIAGALQ